MNKIAKILLSVAVAGAPLLFCEAKCCRPCGGGQIRIGGCKKYSWVSQAPLWKTLPEDFMRLPKCEQARFKEAFELIPKKIHKEAGRTFKQRTEYLKRPNAARDRQVFAAKLAKRSSARRAKLPDEYVLEMYDDMLVYGRSLITGNARCELTWVAERYGFTNVAKFIRKVNSISGKKRRNVNYPSENLEFAAFSKLAQKMSNQQWYAFQNHILQISATYASLAKR